jgi:hypothetical protein
MRVIRAISYQFGDITAIAIILIMLAFAGMAKSDTLPEHCAQWASTKGLEVTSDVIISGEKIVRGDWVIDHDTITIRFGDNVQLVWDHDSVARDRQAALADWIWSALNFERNHGGLLPFAGKASDGRVWLISQYRGHDGQMTCFAHPLDLLEQDVSQGGAAGAPYPTPRHIRVWGVLICYGTNLNRCFNTMKTVSKRALIFAFSDIYDIVFKASSQKINYRGQTMFMFICVRIIIILFFFYSTDAHAMGNEPDATAAHQPALGDTVPSHGYCAELAHSRHQAITHNVHFSGDGFKSGFWEVPHSMITVQFADEPAQVWDVNAATFKFALIDWLSDAITHQKATGVGIFASRGLSGQIYLISQRDAGDAQPVCVPHPLEMW